MLYMKYEWNGLPDFFSWERKVGGNGWRASGVCYNILSES